MRSRQPIMPFSIFRIKAVTGSNVASFALGAGAFGMFFILTLYMQQVLGYSAIETGVAFLATSLAALVASMLTSNLVTRTGPRWPLTIGLVVAAVGILWLAQIPVDGDYLTDLFPGLLLFGIGLGAAFVALSIGALEGVREEDAGLASGLLNTTQQVGGALGVAVLSSLAITRTNDLAEGGTDQAAALTEGFQLAIYAGAGFAIAGAIAVLALVRTGDRPEAEESVARAPIA